MKACEFILDCLKDGREHHVIDMTDTFRRMNAKGSIRCSNRGFASAISRAITKLQNEGKIVEAGSSWLFKLKPQPTDASHE